MSTDPGDILRAIRAMSIEVERLKGELGQANDAVAYLEQRNAFLCDVLREVQNAHERSMKAVSKGSPPYTEPLMWAEYGDHVVEAIGEGES